MEPLEPRPWKIEWNDGMSAGIPELDEDHKRFIALVDGLNRAIVDRSELDEIKRRLQLVLEDVALHFAHEEELFRELHYPDAEVHARAHAQAAKTLESIRERSIMYNLPSEWIAVSMEVKNVLIDHLLTEDRKYAEHFRNLRTAQGTPP